MLFLYEKSGRAAGALAAFILNQSAALPWTGMAIYDSRALFPSARGNCLFTMHLYATSLQTVWVSIPFWMHFTFLPAANCNCWVFWDQLPPLCEQMDGSFPILMIHFITTISSPSVDKNYPSLYSLIRNQFTHMFVLWDRQHVVC